MTAETTDPKPDAPAKPGRRKMGGRNKLLLILFSLLLMGLFRTGFIFIIIGMMPSIVMHFMDVTRKRYSFKTILACNLSAMMPFVGKMASFGPSSTVMESIMGDAANWMLIYGSALIGWALVRVAPMVAMTFIGGFHGTQIAMLRNNQKRIENEWGAEVTQFSRSDHEDEHLH